MTAIARNLPLLALILCLGACEGGGSDARPAEPLPGETQMQMVEVEDPGLERDGAATEGAEVAGFPSTGLYVATSAETVEAVGIRHASLVPFGTDPDNMAAFVAMRKAAQDSFPVAGVGPRGLHVDSLVVGRGFSESRCEVETHAFTVAEDERVNVCLRVVHGGATDEQLSVKWTRDGRGPAATQLRLRNAHAYRTRAWLPVRRHSAGEWNVTVTASDGTVLGSADFVIAPSVDRRTP